MSPACHVSTEIHKLLEHESERPEGTPIIRLPPSDSRLSCPEMLRRNGTDVMTARTAFRCCPNYINSNTTQTLNFLTKLLETILLSN